MPCAMGKERRAANDVNYILHNYENTTNFFQLQP